MNRSNPAVAIFIVYYSRFYMNQNMFVYNAAEYTIMDSLCPQCLLVFQYGG